MANEYFTSDDFTASELADLVYNSDDYKFAEIFALIHNQMIDKKTPMIYNQKDIIKDCNYEEFAQDIKTILTEIQENINNDN